MTQTYQLKQGDRLFFIGIGGISMCGLAELSRAKGYTVAGSDLHPNKRTEYLESLGIEVIAGHHSGSVDTFKPDAVVYSLAVHENNPERARARELGIPQIERSVFLGMMNREFEHVINIAGTNGKTTTTAMCALMLMAAGTDPTVHLGAELKQFKTTVHVGGNHNLMVSEACEFGGSFLKFYSTTAVILNLGHDHVDCYPTMDDVIDVFADFIGKLDKGMRLILPTFDPYMPQLLARVEAKFPGLLADLGILTFGYEGESLLDKAPDLRCENYRNEDGYPEFDIVFKDEPQGHFKLRIPGKYNVDNALAAMLAAMTHGASADDCRETLAEFTGAEGRFTETGTYRGARIIADYAHHPDSVSATIDAAVKMPHEHFYAVFQPITYSRAKGLYEGFVDALYPAENAWLVEVYDDREDDRSFSSAHIADAINERGGNARFFATVENVETALRESLHEGDIALIMGQDVRGVADRLTGRNDHFK